MNADPSTEITVSALLDNNPVNGERKRGPKRHWTTLEQRRLTEMWPPKNKENLDALIAAFPGRTFNALYQRALQLKLPPMAKRHNFRIRKWEPSPQIDEVIRRLYPRAIKRNDVVELARIIGRPRWWTSRRAAKLGLVMPRFKQPDWTPAEDEIVAETAHLDLQTISRRLRKRGYSRSVAAIANRIKRQEISRVDPNNYSAEGLAKLLNIDGKTVNRWCQNGWLKATRRQTERTEAQGGDPWKINRKAVRRFILDHAALIDIRKVDKFWFIDIVGGETAS